RAAPAAFAMSLGALLHRSARNVTKMRSDARCTSALPNRSRRDVHHKLVDRDGGCVTQTTLAERERLARARSALLDCAPMPGTSSQQDLGALLKSRVPLIVIETRDEPRAIELVKSLAARSSGPHTFVFQWTVTDGLRRIDIDPGGA